MNQSNIVAVHPKNPGGRPTKRSPERLAILVDAIARGLTDQQAANLVGISRSTLAEWLKAGDRFSDTIKKARAERLLHRLRLIEAGAIAWILERNYGSQFARPREIGQIGPPHARGEAESWLNEAGSLLLLM